MQKPKLKRINFDNQVKNALEVLKEKQGNCGSNHNGR